MNTQQAISFLTNTATTLSNSLMEFGLKNNGETVISLREKVAKAVIIAFHIREQLFSKLEMLKAKELQAEDELSFAISNQSLEKGRLAELQKQRSLLETAIQNLQGNKQLLSDTGDSRKATIKAEINIIKANITKTESEVATVKKQIADGLALIANYDSLRVQAQSAQEQANYHNQYVQYWGVVGREGGRSGKSKDIYGWITNTAQVNARDSFQAQANQFTQQAAAIQGQVDSFKQSLPVLEGTKNSKTDQIWLYYQELDAKNNVLSFVSTQSGNDVALLDLQLSQSQTDLAQLKNVDIPSQRTTTDGTTQRVTQVQSELDQLKTQKVSAQKDLDSFNQSNKELLTTDLSLELLQDSITKSRAKVTSLEGDLAKPNQSTELINSLTQALALEQAKLGQLKQQYQLAALEVLAVNQDRLESLEGQLAAETSVGGAVKETTIGGYVVLVSQFAEQLTGLSDIWAESLKENHQFTVEVSNLFDSNWTAFVGVKQFIEDDLAVPYSDYVLNGIQLDEALAIQETQVKYRDALAKAVDDLQENIELQKKSVEQTDQLSEKLEHIQNLTSLEKQYVILQASKEKLASGKKDDYELAKVQIIDVAKSLLEKVKNTPSLQGYAANLEKYLTDTLQLSVDAIKNKIYGLETFNEAKLVYNGFGINQTWANQNGVPRFLADVNGDGKADIVGFGSGGVGVALAKGDGTFNTAINAYNGFGINHSWSSQDSYPRFLADVNGDGKADIVGFASGGVVVALAKEDGTFNTAINAYNGFGTNHTWANQNGVPRFLADVNGDGKADIVGFGSGGVAVALAKGDGTFNTAINAYNGFGINHSWSSQDSYPRFLADVNGDGKADIVGFASGGVVVALAKEDGTFNTAINAYNGFGTNHTWANQNGVPRFLADVNGDGKADIVGFASGGVLVALAKGDGTFNEAEFVYNGFGINQTWANQDGVPRFLADVNGDGKADIVGFASGGVVVALSNVTNKQQQEIQTLYTEKLLGLQEQATKIINSPLIVELTKEVTIKTKGLTVEIDLSNDQQEAFIVTSLQKYLQNKQESVFNSQEKQLSLLRETFQQPTRALYFDGVNDYINVAVKPSLKVTTNLTLEAWINPLQDSRTRMIVGREGEYLLALSGADNIIHYAVANSNPGWTWVSTGYGVKSNQWSHIAFSFDNGQIKTYVNGQLIYKYDGIGTIGDADTNQNELRIGNRQWNNTDFFKGQIDEVRVWNVTRNQSEIQTFYNRNLNGTEQGLAGYWNFEESSGNTVNELTANNNQGTLTNGVQRTIDNLAEVKYQPSRSLYFDGINDYVNAGLNSSLKVSSNLTLEAWIKPQAKGNNGLIVSREGEYLLSVGSDNQIYYAVANANPGWTWVGTGYIVSVNQWTHIAFTYNNGEIKLYGNGKLAYYYQGSGAIGDVATNQDELRIGNRQSNNSEFFKGEIDEVKVWNTTRTQAEIQANLSQKLTGTEQGLVGYWNFEETSGQIVTDSTANGNHGMLMNRLQRNINTDVVVNYQPTRTLYFDGVNDYINVGVKPSLKVTTNLTIEAWINLQQDSRTRMIVAREGEYLLALSGADNIIHYAVANSNPGWTWVSTGYGVKSNQWNHIAFSFDNGQIKTYVNGQLVYTYDGVGTIGDANINQNELRIGNRQWNNTDLFKGQIDEVRVWNTTRNQAEIQTFYNRNLNGTEQGLVCYWNFEEGSGNTAIDLTANNNSGILANGVQRNVDNLVPVKYQPSKALYFDGVNDYVNAGTNPSLKVTTNLTIEAWINPQQDSRTRIIVGREGEYLLALSGADNTIFYAVANTNPGYNWTSTGYAVKSNEWSHITFSFDNGRIKTYVNGQLVYTYDGIGTIGDVVTQQDELRIGNRQINGSEFFKGQIDEVRVWNTTRTQAEIQTSLSQILTGTEQGLVGYWNFEETSGQIVTDSTANGNHGILLNRLQRTVNTDAVVKYQPSRALSFDGVNDSVKVSHSSSLDLVNQWTLESWIFRKTTGRFDSIIEKYNWQGGFGGFTLRIVETNKLIANVINGQTSTGVESGVTIDAQQWYHVAATFDSSQKTFKLYVNGVLVGVNSDVTITPLSSNVSLKIGTRGDDSGGYFNGQIDDTRVWNVARTQAQIQASFSQKLTGTEQGLVGYWNFEESIGNTVYDLTTNNNQGTLTNGVQRTVDSSVAVPKVLDEQTNIAYDKTITELEKLRLEIAHLNLQSEKNPDKVQQFLQEYEAGDKTATTLQTLRDKYFPELNQANTLAALQTQINNEIGQSQQQIEQLKASITQKQAQSAAALSQADWYEQQAATHWQLSRKAGPTWTEERTAKGKSGTSKTVTITHVDHAWIIWDTYTKQAVSLREQAANLLKSITTDSTNQNTANDILKQWQEASAVADQTALTQADLTALLNQLDADRQLNGDKKQQIADWGKLLPTLQSQLQKAITDAQTAKANTTKEWTEYQTSQDQYQKNLADVLTRRAQLQSQGQILLQEIDNVDQWVNQQNTLLSDEICQVQALITQLNAQKAAIPSTLSNDQTLTLKALIDQSLQLLTQKQIVLTAEQSTFTQKQTLLETQKKVIQTQYDLLDAYLENPDKDTSNLEKLLADTNTALAEVKKLAEQAEASSNALTVLMDDVQVSLLLQNDKYLSVIRDKQKTLQDLLAATELKENDTLKATQKQIELNGLQTQLLDILKKANDAGSKEAAKLLEIAQYNDFAAVAELYHRDYQDLATDNGGFCSGGIARPEDIQLANYFYSELVKYRQFKTEAEQQVTQFTQLRTLAESQVTALKGQETLAAQELAALQQSIGNSQEQINARQEELGIAQFRVDALLQLRNWTEQTQVQLLSVEQLSLAQAKLEQDIANNRQYLIDNSVKAQLDQQRLSIERDRQIAVVKLEQLNQLKTEEALQTAINNLRTDLGVNPITEIIQLADYKGQLAGVLADIETLKQKLPSLPATTKTLLDSTIQDIHKALQGKETQTIQDNLLKSANTLIDQSNKLKTEVVKLQQEEQRYVNLLTQSQTDLKGATKTLYDEIQKSGVLDSEKTVLNAQNLQVLYKIGYAQGSIDLSSALATQSKDILEQVIKGRIEERKAREKAAFNEIFSTVTLVISAVAAVLTAGASLAATAASAGLSGAAATSRRRQCHYFRGINYYYFFSCHYS